MPDVQSARLFTVPARLANRHPVHLHTVVGDLRLARHDFRAAANRPFSQARPGSHSFPACFRRAQPYCRFPKYEPAGASLRENMLRFRLGSVWLDKGRECECLSRFGMQHLYARYLKRKCPHKRSNPRTVFYLVQLCSYQLTTVL